MQTNGFARQWRVRGIAFAATFALVLGACAPAPPAGQTQGPAARGAGGTLRILYWQAVTILNSHLSQGTKDYDGARLVIEPLAHMGPDGKPVAALAAEVPTLQNGGVSQDLTTVTWKLKPGLKWSDGSDFTADDVVFTYEFMADEKTAAADSFVAGGVKSVVARDTTTVVVTYEEPNPNYYQLFVSGYGNILQKKQFQNCLGEAAAQCPGNSNPIGTGPYKVKEFKPNDVVVYEINQNYRDPNKPFFKEVQFKGGGDATSAARAVFQTGEADYSWNLQVESAVLQQLMQGGRGTFISAVSGNVERLLLNRANPNASGDQRAEPNTQHPFLSDKRVRTALAMAVDRETMAKELYGEAGEATCNIVTSPEEFVSPNTARMDACKFDVAGANRLLDEAGWTRGADGIRQKGGVRMKIVYQTTVNTLRQKEQEIVKQGWNQVGVEVELKAIQAGVFFSTDVANPDTAAKFFSDVEMFTNGPESPEPTNYLSSWYSKEIVSKANGWRGNNYERFSNPEYDRLFEQLRKETDSAKRKDLIIKLNDIVIEDVVIIPLVARKSPVSGHSKELKGIVPNPWDSEMWNIADWSK